MRLVDDVAQRAEHLVVEAELLEGVEGSTDAGDDAVATPFGQSAREELEDRTTVGRAGLQGGLQHGQLVVVGQQRGR